MEIKDLATGKVFKYGTDKHHSLRISEDGRSLHFENLQNGDGSEFGDYRFIDDYEEKIPNETDTFEEYGSHSFFNVGGFATDKLAEYEDLEEQGLLLRLPCKVGDEIYRLANKRDKYGYFTNELYVAYGWLIEHIEVYAEEIAFIDDSDNVFSIEDIGKTVFLTKAEAEEALKKMQEGSDE